jgi:hypothetical protein
VIGHTEELRVFLLGVLAMGDLIAGLFFVRYWKTTHDRLFIYFAVSFGLEVICRFLLIYTTYNSESEPLVYGLRLLSYAVILVGIAEKNHLVMKNYLFNLPKSRA